MVSRQIVLASTSPYRRELLGRLGLPFDTADPATDETPLCGEAPEASALRLSEDKAHERAVRQLQMLRGRRVNFYTGLCLFDARTGKTQVRGVPTLVTFRDLSDEEIERYLRRERPYNCAGSAKSEGLGIALIAK